VRALENNENPNPDVGPVKIIIIIIIAGRRFVTQRSEKIMTFFDTDEKIFR
jgi:hypothetical protein